MRLNNGQDFPEITAAAVGDDKLTIPTEVAAKWQIILFYRGQW